MTKAAIATVVVMVVAALAGYRAGAAQCEAHHQARLAALEADHRSALQRAIAQTEERHLADAELLFAAAEAAQDRELRTRTIVRTVTRVVHQEPDYRRCRLDGCGLCLARAAADDSDAAGCPCPGDDPLPASDAAGGHDGRSADRVYRDGQPLSHLPSAPAGAGAVDQAR